MTLTTALRLLPGVMILCLIFACLALKSNRDKWERQAVRSEEARKLDRQSYEQAQHDAAEANRKQIASIKQQQEAITDEVSNDLGARLERIRRELRQAPAAPSGPSGGPGAGKTVESPCRAIDSTWMCLSPQERLRAAENEERHDQLITLVERQSQVKP